MQEAIIQKFEFTEVIIPAKPDVINSETLNKPLHMLPVKGKDGWSAQFDELPKLVFRMHLSNGVVALGEFYRDHEWDRVESICEQLLGVDIHSCILQKLPLPLCRENDGFECAFWDAYAKTHNMSLYQLLGGAVQNKVKVGAWSSHRTLDEVGPWVKQYHDMGFDCIKFKADLEDDPAGMCEQIAKYAPGMKVIFDPNQRWENVANCKKIVRDLEAIGNCLLLEDPIPKWMVQDYADLRWFTTIPIVQHISLPYVYQGQRLHDVPNLISHRAVDGFNFNAGPTKFRQLDSIAVASNVYCWHGSEIDLGILEAMYLHQSVAAASCVWPSDIFGRYIRSHDLLKEPLRFEPPYAYVPQGPGLGVELDDSALEKYGSLTKEIS